VLNRSDYERLLYALADRYPEVTASTLRLYSNSAASSLVRGSVYFDSGLEVRIFEYIDWAAGELLNYSYTVYRGAEKIRWYDPQPHPDNAALAPTFPHHYHTPPDIKHNRQPAPGVSFDAPNLPALIHDCLELGKTLMP
jgi:hypothetical protein